jgi:hypothetical protein
LSNPTDQASHKFLDQDSGQASSETDQVVARGRLLGNILVASAAVVGGVEGSAYYFHVLQIWQAYLLTPLVPALATLALFIDYELNLIQEPWKRRRLHDEFRKSSLMLVGALVATFGTAVFLASISAELTRVTIDVGAGSTMICSGVYIVKRFSW